MVPAHETRGTESYGERSRPDEASIAPIEEASIQRAAPIVTLVVLVGLAVDLDFAAIIDVVVDKNAFLAGRSFEASAQQRRHIGGDRQAFFRGSTCGCVAFRSGAPRPMKMGTVHSPWHYDRGAAHALRASVLRRHPMLCYALQLIDPRRSGDWPQSNLRERHQPVTLFLVVIIGLRTKYLFHRRCLTARLYPTHRAASPARRRDDIDEHACPLIRASCGSNDRNA